LANTLARVAAAAVLGICLALPASALPQPGSAAPAFTGKTVAGKSLKLSSYKGKVVLLNFFDRH
jgi:hypothetical protein